MATKLNFSQKLEDIVYRFKAEVETAIKDFASDALMDTKVSTGSTRGPTRTATMHTTVHTNGGGGRGVKRDQSVLTDAQETFINFVTKNPGLRIEQINKELGTTTKDLQLPIRKAIASKLVRTEGAKRATLYFPGGGAKKAAAKKATAAKKAAAPKKAKKAAKVKPNSHAPEPEPATAAA